MQCMHACRAASEQKDGRLQNAARVAWEVSKMHVWEERSVRNCENGLNPDAKLLKDKKFEAKLCEQAVGTWQGQSSV